MQWNEDDKGIPVEDRKPIHIYLQNGGGEISYMWLLIDIMEMSKTPIYTVAMNVCASAAALEIFMCGKKRFMLKTALVAYSRGFYCHWRTRCAEVFLIHPSLIRKIIKKMKDFILSKTRIDSKLLNKKRANDWEIDADFCLGKWSLRCNSFRY